MPQIPLGMDHLVVLGMPPLENIRLAEAAGVQTISLMADQSFNPFGFAEWSLLDDRQPVVVVAVEATRRRRRAGSVIN